MNISGVSEESDIDLEICELMNLSKRELEVGNHYDMIISPPQSSIKPHTLVEHHAPDRLPQNSTHHWNHRTGRAFSD